MASVKLAIRIWAKDYCRNDDGKKKLRRCFFAALAFITTFLLIILIAWLVVIRRPNPSKPQFIIQNATLTTFKYFLSTSTLTSNFEISVYSRNPSSRVGIYYEDLDIFATYRGQKITQTTLLPATYQGRRRVCMWSPSLTGYNVQLGLHIGDLLIRDETDGAALINITVYGSMSFKVGKRSIGNHQLNVNCPVYVKFRSKYDGGFAVLQSESKQICRVKF